MSYATLAEFKAAVGILTSDTADDTAGVERREGRHVAGDRPGLPDE